MRNIRVLAADDSALVRTALREIIGTCPEFELVGLARDGEDAVLKARELRPDVITLDINMPKMDGLTALQHITSEETCGRIIMLSSLTRSGAAETFEALALRAFDFVEKPGGSVSSNLNVVAQDLIAKIKTAVQSRSAKERVRVLRRAPSQPCRLQSRILQSGEYAVTLGISTGGPATLMDVLPELPADLPAPLFLVQHMPANFISSFVERLNRSCAMRIVEAQPNMSVEPGVCYVAPGGRHLEVYRKLSGKVIIRTPDQPQTLFVPSVSVMMRSAMKAYGNRLLSILMTGIGDDGAQEMAEVRQAGGFTIAESEETAVVFGMPRVAIERDGADLVLPAWQIAQTIVSVLEGVPSAAAY